MMDAEIEKDLTSILEAVESGQMTIEDARKEVEVLVVGTIPDRGSVDKKEKYQVGFEDCKLEMLSRWTNKEKL